MMRKGKRERDRELSPHYSSNHVDDNFVFYDVALDGVK